MANATPPLSADDYRLLIDGLHDYAIFVLDLEGRITSWSAGAEKINGYDAGEVIGRHYSLLYPPEALAAQEIETELRAAVENERFEHEGWRVRKDGSRYWANAVITALRDEHGGVRGFGKVTKDLTRWRLSDELRRSEERFHHLVDAVSDYAIFMLDATGHVATWNAGACRTKGYEASEIIGKHFEEFYTQADRAAERPKHILETVRREGRFQEENWRVRKDGTRFWASVVITAIRDGQGEVTGFAKVTRDLTDRRLAEERVRLSEERFRLLVEGVLDYAIYMLDPKGHVTTWNLGAARMKGYSAAEILGRHFSVFFSAKDIAANKPTKELATAAREGRFEEEGWRARRDGSLFWANVVVTPLRNDQGELLGFSKVTRDLSGRREAEAIERKLVREQAAREAAQASAKQLRDSEEEALASARAAEEAARRAEEANRVKDEFLATVSHELRTPLNAILGYASLNLSRTLRGSPEQKAFAVIHRNAEAQAKLIEDILDVSRIITGKMRLDVKRTNLMRLVNEAVDVIRPSAQGKGITLDIVADDVIKSDAVLLGDPERLRQVVWNLLSNAVKFTGANGHVSLAIAREGAALALEVKDTGRGIEPEFLPYVFERFRQADSTTTRRFGGLGLGLAIVRHIVELHGGQVSARSDGPDKGAVFRVVFPAREEPAIPSSPPTPHGWTDRTTPVDTLRGTNARRLEGTRILAVDDDEDARALLYEVLTSEGAIVVTASSAREALQCVEQFRPHMLVSDIGMPGEDGYSLLRRVRALPGKMRDLPAIALTAYTRPADHERSLEAGFTKHLGKLIDPQHLAKAIAEVLEGIHAQKRATLTPRRLRTRSRSVE